MQGVRFSWGILTITVEKGKILYSLSRNSFSSLFSEDLHKVVSWITFLLLFFGFEKKRGSFVAWALYGSFRSNEGRGGVHNIFFIACFFHRNSVKNFVA